MFLWAPAAGSLGSQIFYLCPEGQILAVFMHFGQMLAVFKNFHKRPQIPNYIFKIQNQKPKMLIPRLKINCCALKFAVDKEDSRQVL